MSRTTLFMLVLLLLIAGGAVFLSSSAHEVPTKTIEADVSRDSAVQ